MNLIMIEPRGFCAGVERAINIVSQALKVLPSPIFVNHEIVHNSYIVESFRKKGVIFTEDIDSIPNGSTLIFNAHGVSPKLVKKAQNKNLKVIDATCPLVSKVHFEVLRYKEKGYKIILIGHQGHPEVVGVLGYAPDEITLVENKEDVKNLFFREDEKIAYVTQTTLSYDDCALIIEALKKKYRQIVGPKKSDICYATTNRQEAVRAIAQDVNIILIIGSPNSSNSNRLQEVAQSKGCKSYLINSCDDIDLDSLSKVSSVAISAGASTPENIVQEVVSYLKENLPINDVSTFKQKDESVQFALPKIEV